MSGHIEIKPETREKYRMSKAPRDTTQRTIPSVTHDAASTKSPPKGDRTPWRLQVVEAWFERGRKAGLKTAEERLQARNKDKQTL